MMRGVARQFAGSAIVIVGALVALELLQATALVGAVLGAAGVVGIAIGFAFRDIVENYLASLLLGLRRPFEPNDLVVIAGNEGKVIRLTTRETILMSLDGNHVRLPNAHVFKSVIVNFTRNPLRRLSFKVGIGVSESLVDAQHVGLETLRETAGVCPDPGPFTRVEELADSTVVVQYFAWVDQRAADWHKVRSEAVRRVKAALDAANIAMPVPTYRLETEKTRAPGGGKTELADTAHEVIPDDVIDRQIRDDAEREPAENLLKDEEVEK
jgi:small-conductance mechanosensitive channel